MGGRSGRSPPRGVPDGTKSALSRSSNIQTRAAGEGPIGVFDSGIGGLTVVRAIRRRLKDESVVYFGDPARFPYGTKSEETIRRFAVEDAEFLLNRGVKLVVVACHSASSAALPELARRLPVPVVGVIEPGARALVSATKTGRVAVIGTSATIRAGAYERAVRALRPEIEVVARATPLFVSLAEEGWLDGEVPESVARRYLGDMAGEGVDAVLLGCTHFPLLSPAIGRVLGPGVRLVDSSEETAAEVARLVRRGEEGKTSTEAPKTGPTGKLRVYLSDLVPSYETVGVRFLGEPLGEVVRASPGRAARGE